MTQDEKDLQADLEFAQGRILGLQDTGESLENAGRVKDARNEQLERENATLSAKLAANDKAMRITMVQNLARRAA